MGATYQDVLNRMKEERLRLQISRRQMGAILRMSQSHYNEEFYVSPAVVLNDYIGMTGDFLSLYGMMDDKEKQIIMHYYI